MDRELSRRGVLAGAGGLSLGALLAACGSSNTGTATSPTAAGTPKKGGQLRLAVAGSGAKDIIDGQNIVEGRPGAPDPSWGHCSPTPRLEAPMTAGRGGHRRADVWVIRIPGHRVPQRQDPRRRGRHLLAAAAVDPKPTSSAMPRCRQWTRKGPDQGRRDHRADDAEAADSTIPVTGRLCRPHGRSATRGERTRSAPVRSSCRASSRASSRFTSGTRTTGARASRTSTR